MAGGLDGLQIFAAVVTKTQVDRFAGDGLLDDIGVPLKLIADRCADKVGAVGIEAFLHHQINVAEIDVTKIDLDLLGVAWSRSQLLNVAHKLLPSS